MTDPYLDREQTRAKHFLLRAYLQAFKILRYYDLTYIDGFSGPWKTQTEGFSDSSFMIAITALKDAQQKIFSETGKRPRVRCFLSERDPVAFEKLHTAVEPYHRPQDLFEVQTYCGKFEDAVSEIRRFAGNSFSLIFIDPTGWSGYPFEKIKSLFQSRRCEVLINFMHSFVVRFIEADEPEIIESLNPILGGPGWRARLDPELPRGEAVEKLFRETLKLAGNFEFVVATKIDKSTQDRPHFFMAYGTKAYDGLNVFRDIEYQALRAHAAHRAGAKERKREAKSGSRDLFADHEADIQEASIGEIANELMVLAKTKVVDMLRRQTQIEFTLLAANLMEKYMLRETNVKDVLVRLARDDVIESTWGVRLRKPRKGDLIRLKSPNIG